MAVFKSKYRELSFYVDGKLLSFAGGSFSTNDKKVITVLEKLKDVKRLDKVEDGSEEQEKDIKQEEPTKEEQPKAEGTKQKDTKKKSSAK